MHRAAVLNQLENSFAREGYTTDSEQNAKCLLMTHPNGSSMQAETSVGSSYGYLQVNDPRGTLHLLIRLGAEGPYIYPHELHNPEGRELLQRLVENCEAFRKDWLRQYLKQVA